MGQLGRLRVVCALVALALAVTACANGRPKPATCAAVGAMAGAGAGAAAGVHGMDYDWTEWRNGAWAAGGAAVLGTAGYFICKAMAKGEVPPTPPTPPTPPPPIAPAPPPPPPEPAVAEKIILRGVNFDFDKDGIRPDAAVILDEAARILETHKGARVRVEGHADATGPDAYNQGLSERRANSVRSYLASRGVDASRLTPLGFGESRPIASNDTREGRALNRRVELQVEE